MNADIFDPKEAITQALKQFDKIEAELLKSLPNTDDYVINGVWDEEGYKSAKSALRDAKKVSKSIEDKRKELKAIALDYGRAVDGRAKDLHALCLPTISTFEERIATVDMQREKIKQEKRYNREMELKDAGFEFAFGAYRIGVEVVHPTAIDDAGEEDWEGILQRGRDQSEKLREQREREQREREELAKERAELEKMRREIEEAKKVPVDDEVFLKPDPAPAPAPAPDPAPLLPAYESGFDACRLLAIEAVKTIKNRSEIIVAIENFRP